MRRAWLGLLLAACGSSPGHLTNLQRAPADFVAERDELLVEGAFELTRIRLDSGGRRAIVPAGYRVVSATRSGDVLALMNGDTNLYVWTAGSPKLRRVSQLDRRTGAVAVRPDGEMVAAARHAESSTPDRSSWDKTEDDAIYLIDTKTLAIDVVPKARDERISNIVWAQDGQSVVLGLQGGDMVRLDLALRARTATTGWPPIPPAIGQERCAQTGERIQLRGRQGDQGFDIVDAQGNTRQLVSVEGRSRGFHDYRPTIGTAVFTPSCRYIVFEYQTAVWIADVATGTVGHLIAGWSPRLLATP